MLVAAAASLIAGGCGSTVHEAADDPMWPLGVVAGNRLRPIVNVGDGAAAFDGWYDSSLDVPCTFSHAADGRMRCMPIGWMVIFLDSACSEPALVTRCGPEIDYGALRDQAPIEDPCAPRDPNDSPSLMYRRAGAAVEAKIGYQAKLIDGQIQCDPAPTTIGADDVLVPAELVPLDTFVAAEETIEHGAGRLERRVRVADDGARQLLGPYDTELGEPCSPRLQTGPDVCVPENVGQTWGFADPGCTELATNSYCEPPAVIMQQLDACTFQLRGRGAEVPRRYLQSADGCTPDMTQADNDHVYRVGPEVGPGVLAPLIERRVGSGRLQARQLTDRFGMLLGPSPFPAALPPNQLYDAELDARCLPFEQPSGEQLCEPPIYPTGYSALHRFADAACTEPALLVDAKICPALLPKVVSRTQPASGACGSESYLDTRARLGSLGQVYDKSSGSCVESPLGEKSAAFALGPALGPESFAPARRQVW